MSLVWSFSLIARCLQPYQDGGDGVGSREPRCCLTRSAVIIQPTRGSGCRYTVRTSAYACLSTHQLGSPNCVPSRVKILTRASREVHAIGIHAVD
jgi:hypothetical protein